MHTQQQRLLGLPTPLLTRVRAWLDAKRSIAGRLEMHDWTDNSTLGGRVSGADLQDTEFNFSTKKLRLNIS